MLENEVIIVDAIPPSTYKSIAFEAARYGIISVSFTYDRMGKVDIIKRISNIIKGKIAEGLFYHFCTTNDIPINTDACVTPFWLPDQRDFIYMNGEWDMKNNFYYPTTKSNNTIHLTDLPALIPNKYSGDQWSKRDKLYLENTRYGAYLFTYMPLDGKSKSFFSLSLTPTQLDRLNILAQKFSLASSHDLPSYEKRFWEYLNIDHPEDIITMTNYPTLYITACANTRYWHLFEDIEPHAIAKPYLDHCSPYWYESKNNIVKFLHGQLVTTIKNKTCPISALPSFLSIHPHLKEKIYCGRINVE